MNENCTVCGNAGCVDPACAAIENARWGEVGFEIPYSFNKVYLAEGPVEMDYIGLDPVSEDEVVDPDTTEEN